MAEGHTTYIRSEPTDGGKGGKSRLKSGAAKIALGRLSAPFVPGSQTISVNVPVYAGQRTNFRRSEAGVWKVEVI